MYGLYMYGRYIHVWTLHVWMLRVWMLRVWKGPKREGEELVRSMCFVHHTSATTVGTPIQDAHAAVCDALARRVHMCAREARDG